MNRAIFHVTQYCRAMYLFATDQFATKEYLNENTSLFTNFLEELALQTSNLTQAGDPEQGAISPLWLQEHFVEIINETHSYLRVMNQMERISGGVAKPSEELGNVFMVLNTWVTTYENQLEALL